MSAHDEVNHPKHYTQHPSGVECITITEHMSFNLGNAMKYIWRADLKNGFQDLEKAAWYLNRELERRKAGAGRPPMLVPAGFKVAPGMEEKWYNAQPHEVIEIVPLVKGEALTTSALKKMMEHLKGVKPFGLDIPTSHITNKEADEIGQKLNETIYGPAVAEAERQNIEASKSEIAGFDDPLPERAPKPIPVKTMPKPEDDGRTLPFRDGGFLHVGAHVFFTKDPNEKPSTLLKIFDQEALGVCEVWDPVKNERLTVLARHIIDSEWTR